MLLSVILSLPIIALSAADCPEERRALERSWETKLRQNKLCNYRIYERPVKNQNTSIAIGIRMTVTYFSFDSDEEVLTIHSLLSVLWTDEFLTWNSSDYEGIEEMQVYSYQIWSPTLTFLNAKEYNKYGIYTLCTVTWEGVVACLLQEAHTATCSTRLTTWPYDTQTCRLIFGTNLDIDTKTHFEYLEPGITILGAKKGPGWDIANATARNGVIYFSNKPSLEYVFILQRQSSGHGALSVLPTITAAILTLISLLPNDNLHTGFGIIIFSILAHFVTIRNLSWTIPKHSAYPPLILLFLRNSMLVTLIIALITVFFHRIRSRVVAPPLWIVHFTDYVSKCPVKFIVFMDYDSNATVSDDVQNWTQFTNVFNSILFIIVIVVYILSCITSVLYVYTTFVMKS